MINKYKLPLYNWWKARKYFKFPKTHISFCYKKEHHKHNLLNIYFHDVEWKWKDGAISVGSDPIFCITLLNLFSLTISWNITYIGDLGKVLYANTEYWEFLLTYLYNSHTKKSLYKSILKNTAFEYSPIYNKNMLYRYYIYSLNKRGFKKLEKDYYNERSI